MKSKQAILKKLDQATDRLVSDVIKQGLPLPISGKIVLVGNVYIRKNKDGTYDILRLNKTLIETNIYSYITALVLAQKYNIDDFSNIKKILYLDTRYSKYHSDVLNYTRCLRTARKNNDIERCSVLEDKIAEAELRAKSFLNQISIYKLSK
jgi:hypothetical protein